MRALAASALVLAALAACNPFANAKTHSVIIERTGTGSANETQAISCSGSVQLSVEWSGASGSLHVVFVDALSRDAGVILHDAVYAATSDTQTAYEHFKGNRFELSALSSDDWDGTYQVAASCF
jgi:hypothetical protein